MGTVPRARHAGWPRRWAGARHRVGLGAWLALAVLFVAACASVVGTRAPARATEASGSFRAGAAAVDITPPPGYGMGGHSVEGEIGRGFWTRLWVRTVYLESARGEPLVLAVTDLWGMPAGLVDRVAELASQRDGLEHLGRDAIILAATHTHHGPAPFATTRIFARFVGPRPGFDPVLFEFLAQRIATSIEDAARRARPATLRYGERAVPGVARNRSVVPFVRNPEAAAIVEAAPAAAECHLEPLQLDGPPPADPCRALDPTLRVLRIDARDEPAVTLAVIGIFAAHPTAMPNFTPLYHGDLFTAAVTRAEERWTEGAQPVVALFNAAEGDVSPNWAAQGRADTVRLGRALGDALVATAVDTRRVDAHRIARSYQRLPIADQPVHVAGGGEARTAARGFPGTATLGGAEDGRTGWYDLGLKEGRVAKRERLEGHGRKRPAFPVPLLSAYLPRDHIALHAELGVYAIGPLRLVTLPGELTTVTGLRVRRSVAQRTGVDESRVLALGLASAHLEYFATPQEYALQHYEGSSTFYGPHASTWVAQSAGEVAADGWVRVDEEYRYEPGRRRRVRPSAPRLTRRRREGLAKALSLPSLDAAASVTFEDTAPTWPPADDAAPLYPRARIEVQRDGRWSSPRDRTPATAFATVLTRTRGDRWTWRIWLLEPPRTDAPIRLHVTTVDGRDLCSKPLTIGPAVPAHAC